MNDFKIFIFGSILGSLITLILLAIIEECDMINLDDPILQNEESNNKVSARDHQNYRNCTSCGKKGSKWVFTYIYDHYIESESEEPLEILCGECNKKRLK